MTTTYDKKLKDELAETRLQRYFAFTQNEFAPCMLRNKEYSMEFVDPAFLKKIQSGHFRTVLFLGMGCSAVVSYLVRAFMLWMSLPKALSRPKDEKPPVYIEIANDYDLEYWTDIEKLKNDDVLVVITSYSGWSAEPTIAFDKIRQFTNNILMLTSGGNMKELAKREKVSMILWKMSKIDPVYPLFQVPQYFSCLLDMFHVFNMLPSNYYDLVQETVPRLTMSFERQYLARHIANVLKDRHITMLTTSKWFLPLTKTFEMHFSEIALVGSHSNYIHEFSHSAVSTFTDPSQKQAILLFKEETEDSYTNFKINYFQNLFCHSDKTIVVLLTLKKSHFIDQYFDMLMFICYVVYFLGTSYNTVDEDYISLTTGNSYYSTTPNNIVSSSKL